jgi:hypothetical protein
VWNLPFGVWLGFAAEVDAYVKAQREAGKK